MGNLPKKIEEELKKIIGQNIDNISFLEEDVTLEKQISYFESTKRKRIPLEQINEAEETLKLNNENATTEEKEQALINLAGLNTVTAYRTLEKYATISPPELTDTAKLAMRECRYNLEYSLTGQKRILVSTGLGSKKGKIRYFVAIASASNTIFTQTIRKILENELNFATQSTQAEIEEIVFSDKFAKIKMLAPFNTSIRNIITKCIEECNNLGNCINDNYLITNVKTFDDEELEKIMTGDTHQ